MDRILSGSTSQGQSEPRSDGNEGVLCIPQCWARPEQSEIDI